jgi:hypothetical protein
MIRFSSALPLQIFLPGPTGELQNTNTLSDERNTDAIVAAIRPQLKALSFNTRYPAGEISKTPFQKLKDDPYYVSGMIDADVFHKQQKTYPILLTGPQALHHIVKTEAEDLLENSPKHMPGPATRIFVNHALGHNCFHEAVAGNGGEVAQMVVMPNKNPQQAREIPWLVASVRYPVASTEIAPVSSKSSINVNT